MAFRFLLYDVGVGFGVLLLDSQLAGFELRIPRLDFSYHPVLDQRN